MKGHIPTGPTRFSLVMEDIHYIYTLEFKLPHRVVTVDACIHL